MKTKLSTGEAVTMRELTTGDIFDATDASKSIHMIPKAGPIFVVDHVELERLLLLKSIVDVNGDKEKVTLNWLRSLPPADYEILQNFGEKIDRATLQEVGERGRDSAAS